MGIGEIAANSSDKELLVLEKGKSRSFEKHQIPVKIAVMAANNKGKGKKNWRKHQKKSASAIQKLYDACKIVFASSCTGFIPSLDNLEKLQAILENIKPADVGIHPDMHYFRNSGERSFPAITYLHIHENEKFSIGIFCLPPSAVIPLHNHPGMTVFSKLLFGTMQVKSFDWVGSTSSVTSPSPPHLGEETRSNRRLAKVKVDSEFTAPCKPLILYPEDGGNMHCFTAVTSCAILDVLGPPYSDVDGRHCTYFRPFSFSDTDYDGVCIAEDDRKQYAWLEEVNKPENLSVLGERYAGPKIQK